MRPHSTKTQSNQHSHPLPTRHTAFKLAHLAPNTNTPPHTQGLCLYAGYWVLKAPSLQG